MSCNGNIHRMVAEMAVAASDASGHNTVTGTDVALRLMKCIESILEKHGIMWEDEELEESDNNPPNDINAILNAIPCGGEGVFAPTSFEALGVMPESEPCGD